MLSDRPPLPACICVVPVHNEEGALASTLARLQAVATALREEVRLEILVVDDGSTDRSPEILAQTSGIGVLRRPARGGYGSSIRAAVDRSEQEWIVIVDADGTYPIEDIPKLWRVGQASSRGMVVGARTGPGITSARVHQAARWALRCLVLLLTGVWVPDLNSGLRLFPRSLFVDVRPLFPEGFSLTTTLTVSALFLGVPIRYVPIRYEKRVGASHIAPIRDFFGFALRIVRLCAWFAPHRLVAWLSLLCGGITVLIDRDAPRTAAMAAAGIVLIGLAAGVVARRAARRSRRRYGIALQYR